MHPLDVLREACSKGEPIVAKDATEDFIDAGEKSAAILVHTTGATPYGKAIVESAKRLREECGTLRDWKYMTQYSSGNCLWADKIGNRTKII